MSPERFDESFGQPGIFIAVVGPSGAGKDTLLRLAAERLAEAPTIRFAKRVITREADPNAEDHETTDVATFEHLEAQGRFCLTWRAHDLAYGLPSDLCDECERGVSIVANVSRRVLAEAANAFPRLAVITVTAPASVLVDRIVARGREARPAAEQRVARSAPATIPNAAEHHEIIDNSGDIEKALGAFCAALSKFTSTSRVSALASQ